MELRQLKYFIKTAETLNFSEAARSLYITQSTLSQQIRTLEDELGVSLFQRDSHSVNLTESGEKMLPLAIQTMQDAESCQDQIRDLQRMLTGTLNIGVTYSFGPILAETINTFMHQYPGVKLNISYSPMEDLMGMLRRREVDFVLAFKPSVISEEIESHSLFEDYLSVIMRTDHPLADRSSLSIDDIRRHKIAVPAKGLQARNVLDRYVDMEHSDLDITLEINDANMLLDIIQGNQLLTILSEATIHDRDRLKAIPLELPDNQMHGCVHTLKKVYRKKSADVFVKMLRESNAVMGLSGKWL